MDGLWLVEGRLSYEEITEGWPELWSLRRRAAGKSIRHALVARSGATGAGLRR
jgi:hypothetical protein